MDKEELLIKNWQRRNIYGAICKNKKEAVDKVLELVPKSAPVGLSGSMTLEALDIASILEGRGNTVFNQNKAGITKEERLKLREKGVNADYFLTSANAISCDGKLVFFSAYGTRTAGIANAKNVIVICATDKIVDNIDLAIKRAREYATPLNCKRLNWQTPCVGDGLCKEKICLFPEYNRMCCQILIIEAEIFQDRLKVILVQERLGF
jgi:L-lactate utilization protein LutB